MSPVLVNPYRYGAPAGNNYQSTVLADSPLAFWNLDDGATTTMADSSGNSHAGSYVNSPTRGVTGLIADGGTAVNFDGISQYASVTGAAWMNVSNYSIEFVVQTTANNVYFIARDGASAAKVWSVFVRTTGTVAAVSYNSGGTAQQVNGVKVVNDGAVHHIVVTKSGTTLSIYIDGTLDSSGSISAAATNNTQDITIAQRGNGSGFIAATFDGVAFYGAALSSTRVAAHAAAM